MATYVKSNKAWVFPSAYRSKKVSGKFTSENNFTNIINSIVDKTEGYVLDYSEFEGSKLLRLVIRGYYFELTDPFTTSEYINNGKLKGNIFAYIVTAKGDTDNIGPNSINYLVSCKNYESRELDSDNDEFTGVAFVVDENSVPRPGDLPANVSLYRVRITDKDGNLKTSRFNSNSIEVGANESTAKTLTDVLDSKQNNLSTGYGIDLSQDSKIKLNDSVKNSIESLKNIGGNGSILSSFNDKGIASNATNLNIGSNKTLVYVENGNIKPGITFYSGTGNPDSIVKQPKTGDIYFKVGA